MKGYRKFIRILTAVIVVFIASHPSQAQEEIKPTEDTAAIDKPMVFPIAVKALLRNDAVYLVSSDTSDFSDILESRVVLERTTDKWKFYADGRLYLYYGEAANTEGKYETKLMRSFIRYYSKVGDITLGKTYVNFGNPGIFNPFEQDKSVVLNDLSYDKEGTLALEYHYSLGSLAGWKIYGGTDLKRNESDTRYVPTYLGGASLFTNIRGFDLGGVVMRNDMDRNLAGAYFKGDLIVGVNGSYAMHMYDSPDSPASEATAGLDYSFLDGQLILTALFYFNQRGSSSPAFYQYSPDYYFAAHYYCYGNITFRFDEFFSTKIDSFVNCIDGSTIIMPSCTVVIANGLSASILFSVLTGNENDEFAPDRYGRFGTLIRVEGKF